MSLAALGFDPARLRFGGRTAVAACLALLVAWLAGLEHPQWSAMTVWAASQPTPGPLVEKAFFRLLGTVAGSVVGVLIVLASGGEPLILVPVLVAWVGLCAGAGNALRGFVSYGALLAGYSASMVALLDMAHPERILSLGLDRMLTVLAGVLVALLVGLALGGRPADGLADRSRQLTARLLRGMAGRLAGGPDDAEGEQRAILSEMAAIEEGLDPHGAGSLRSRRSARTIRGILTAQVAALLWWQQRDEEARDPAVAAALARAAEAIERDAEPPVLLAALEEAEAAARHDPALRQALRSLADALRERLAFRDGSVDPPAAPFPVILHRDWISARHAALRTIATLSVVGAVWLLTGWSGGAFMLLGTSVMVTVFSTFDTPALMMRHILVGQILGGIGALACRWLVWPMGGSGLDLVLLMMPFMLLGALPFAHRRLPGGIDYNMMLLLLLQPSWPLTGTFGHSLAVTLSVVAAPVVALAAFQLVLPADPGRRMDRVISLMLRELREMAASPDAAGREALWRARLHHRLLLLVRWREKSGAREVPMVDGALAVLRLGEAIIGLQELARRPFLPATAVRRARIALGRIARDPASAGPALERLARELPPPEARPFTEAARSLPAAAPFLDRGRG